MTDPVRIQKVITVNQVDRYSGLNCWGNSIEVNAGDTKIEIRCTEQQLTELRDRLMDKFPVETEEETYSRD